MSRLRAIQYHAVIYAPDANGGPGEAKLELTSDMLNLVWQQGMNFPAQAVFSLTRWNPKIASLQWMIDHIKIFRETDAGTKVVFAGKIIKPSYTGSDLVVTCWDYVSFLQRSRTGFRTLYPSKKIGTEIVSPEWTLAKNAATSPLAFVATGTIQDPLGDDDVTLIKTNSEFGVVDFDRLFLFYALAEMSMANTANTVVFEITRETPHTFNFWKDRTAQVSRYYPAAENLIDYDNSGNEDQIQNDIATIIEDPTTGEQTEYTLSDSGSITTYRRLQSAVSIKTLFGVTTGTTETDQQKAALARMLTMLAIPPRMVGVYPRQGDFDPFVDTELGYTFKVQIPNSTRTGLELNTWMKWAGITGAWSPDGGELLQLYFRL